MLMSLKKVLLTLICLVAFISSYAQDKIYKKNGDVIEAKVTSVNLKNISYKRADNLSGPEYTIYKKDVDKIVYENGSKDEFDEEEDNTETRRMPPSPFRNHKAAPNESKYGKNIIAVAPLQLTNDNIQGGVGFSLSYERMLDKNGIISLYVPAILSFSTDNNNYYNNNVNNNTYSTFYIMPGIKFYPTGSRGVVRYAVGPSFVIAAGNTGNGYDQFGNPVSGSYSIFGFMVNNSLNICPTPHLYLGLELGLGVSYVTNQNNTYNSSVGIGADPMVQFAFKVGYRF